MKEVWKDIPNYEGLYQVSNLGRVKSFRQSTNHRYESEYILKPIHANNGYCQVTLYDNTIRHKFLIHRLVAEAFIPNPENLPQVNHKDENPYNNAASNLEWCTNDYNSHYGTRIQRCREANMCCETTSLPIYSIDQNGKKEIYESIGEAERMTGCSHSNIVRTLKGRSNHCGGRKWFYC